MIYREDERYIMCSKEGYEKRYRKRLKVEGCECNYLDGLEWVYNYYRGEGVDLRWKYNYDYGPLLGDVIKHIHKEMKSRAIESSEPFTPLMQRMYVLPKGMLGEELEKEIIEYYPKTHEYTWAFCRYIWEGHPKLPEIKMEMLEKIIKKRMIQKT
jgi:5'-3' exonuclease